MLPKTQTQVRPGLVRNTEASTTPPVLQRTLPWPFCGQVQGRMSRSGMHGFEGLQ